jgi:hypothetical protein
MDELPTRDQPTAAWAAPLTLRPTRAVLRLWWLTVTTAAIVGYVGAIQASGMLAPAGGSVVVAGLVVVVTVARNASAEAVAPGSVRPGSLLRAAGFGLVGHGGLLVAASVPDGFAGPVAAWVLGGAVLVGLSRPATLAALGATAAVEARPESMTTPEIVAELRVTAPIVRAATDPLVRAGLMARRGRLIEEIDARDPRVLRVLLEEEYVPGQPGEATQA